MSEIELKKKLSVKEITGLSPAELKENVGKTVCKIAGVIEGVTQKATPYGAATAFLGDFVAENQKGERFSGNTLYLPDKGAIDLFEAKVKAAAENGGSVEFAGEVTLAKSDKGSMGYTYIFRPIRTEEKEAKQAQLLGMLGGSTTKQVENKTKK